MRSRRRLALVLAALTVMGTAQVASGSHLRPQGATPVRVALVPAYNECTAPNRTHGPPLGFQSCSPPVQTSQYVTVGSPDANGAGANSVGFVEIKVKTTAPAGVIITSTISDVRCLPGTAASVCSGANGADGPDYSGELQMNAMIRITDHHNGPGLNESATVVDIPFPANLTCTNTVDTSTGALAASLPTLCSRPSFPAVVYEERRRHQPDPHRRRWCRRKVATSDNTRFEVQGLFNP